MNYDMCNSEAAGLVAKMLGIPVSEIEDIDVMKKTVEYAVKGKYSTISKSVLIKRVYGKA